MDIAHFNLWIGFLAVAALLIAIDMISSRRLHEVSIRMAALHLAGWIAAATGIGIATYFLMTPLAAAQYATAYLVEIALSVDNVFVFAVIFAAFKTTASAQRRALLWGVVGAIVLRALCILGGIALLNEFDWLKFLFGAILVLTAIKLLVQSAEPAHVADNGMVRFFKRVIPLSDDYDGDKFFTRLAGSSKRVATPLLLVVLVIEFSDLVFAIDSIPAVIGITNEPLIAFSSNIMAILGLRALYFVVAGVLHSFESLKYGLSLVLLLIGIKLFVEPMGFHVEPMWMLAGIGSILGANALIALLPARPSGSHQ
ncbi:MAG: TerC/Alx family metal homeostasis membrane protein [Planctomycetota bacterium]|nr:TerC/Alx family metal homeostasis membrane protein [Planctomycetota bacterium]